MTAHQSVLLSETIQHLAIKPDGVYIDCTFGRGGHAKALLDQLTTGHLHAFDRDVAAIAYAQEHPDFKGHPRFSSHHLDFAAIYPWAEKQGLVGKIDGVMIDMGVSSPQLDQAERGFSFQRQGALDMRMDDSQGITARDWLQKVDEAQLADVIWRYGEERYSRRIARAICAHRRQQPIEDTLTLANVVKEAVPYRGKNHPATKTFQAIRMVVNDELEQITQCLEHMLSILAPGGRLALITFHALETRIVKDFIKNYRVAHTNKFHQVENAHDGLKVIINKLKPSMREQIANPRSRSAWLRVVEKV